MFDIDCKTTPSFVQRPIISLRNITGHRIAIKADRNALIQTGEGRSYVVQYWTDGTRKQEYDGRGQGIDP